MDDLTLTALRGSIAKWEAIVAGTGEDEGPWNCALCKEFFTGADEGDECLGCPVREKTGKGCCRGTPYVKWEKVSELGNVGRIVTSRKTRALAQAELDFLKSLLPTTGA